MKRFTVICDPSPLEGTYEADDEEEAIDCAMDEWITSLGPAADAITSGTFTVRQVEA